VPFSRRIRNCSGLRTVLHSSSDFCTFVPPAEGEDAMVLTSRQRCWAQTFLPPGAEKRKELATRQRGGGSWWGWGWWWAAAAAATTATATGALGIARLRDLIISFSKGNCEKKERDCVHWKNSLFCFCYWGFFFKAFSSWVLRREEERLEKEREGGRERERRRKKGEDEKMHVVHICLRSHKSARRIKSHKSVTRRWEYSSVK